VEGLISDPPEHSQFWATSIFSKQWCVKCFSHFKFLSSFLCPAGEDCLESTHVFRSGKLMPSLPTPLFFFGSTGLDNIILSWSKIYPILSTELFRSWTPVGWKSENSATRASILTLTEVRMAGREWHLSLGVITLTPIAKCLQLISQDKPPLKCLIHSRQVPILYSSWFFWTKWSLKYPRRPEKDLLEICCRLRLWSNKARDWVVCYIFPSNTSKSS
jgi:hypothetical protein